MTTDSSKTERCFFSTTLVGVVKGLEGQYTTIDLRNESCVTGKIINVDGYMNIELEDAVFYNQRGSEHAFTSFFVSARLIRYVHIPGDKDPVQIVQDLLGEMRKPKKSNKVRTFKTKRAEKYHQETTSRIAALKKMEVKKEKSDET